MFQGTLFASDFLTDSIRELSEWKAVSDEKFQTLKSKINKIFADFPTDKTPNESQTEDDLIWPILSVLGWTYSLRQQNMSKTGREEIPDGLLFLNEEAKTRANELTEFRRFEFGACLVESKRWARPLDRGSKSKDDRGTPSAQMLRYLSRADTLTDRKLKWGILTNGVIWRLYWQDAKSRANDYFEVDVQAALKAENDHALRAFVLLLGRAAFDPDSVTGQTLHDLALEKARLYEAKVADSLAEKIFHRVFPKLATAIAHNMPKATMEEVREAGLVVLYRLLFILYAEDRDLLPVDDLRYDDYGLREKVRNDIGRRLNDNDVFAETMPAYWDHFARLCLAIDKGEKSIGVPPYNGGLFNTDLHPVLNQLKLPDTVMADLIDAMCFETATDGSRKYINYRDLSVQQLGSVYERLLEFEIVKEDGGVILRPNIFARKGSGSYYTPQDLVELIIDETVGPLKDRAYANFENKGQDVAEQILNLKICDPAMGSGHFLVTLVDYLSDEVLKAIAYADDNDTHSPVVDRISIIREKILSNAQDKNWTVKAEQLDDPQIVRRMVLKRCIFGVDKNPMAVELAKVALWLHTFTVGAPLSFLDHHLKCGDSLFGMTVYDWRNNVEELGGSLMAQPLVKEATSAEMIMKTIEMLADAEIEEVEQSKSMYGEMMEKVSDLFHFMSFAHALQWMKLSKTDKGIVSAFYTEHFGDPKWIMAGSRPPRKNVRDSERFQEIWDEAEMLMREENFFHWQVAFPGIWERWASSTLHGGFDAIIGNPPWDRIKLQQVEWFAARKPEIALKAKAADRKKAIKALEKNGDPLFDDFKKADMRARQQLDQARKGGKYPWLGRGDINLYSLFVERAQQLIKKDGYLGLLVPSGIASDKTAAPFFKDVATKGRLKALYDFENKKIFFPDVHASFKFCAFIASGQPQNEDAKCAFYMHSVDTILDDDRCFTLSATDFAQINPNTGTAPIFRTRRDAELTRRIYAHMPILVDRSSGAEEKTWPVKYTTMFHMTNDSDLFRTRKELETEEGAYPIGGNLWEIRTANGCRFMLAV